MNSGHGRARADPAYVDDLIRKITETPEQNFLKLLRMAEFDRGRDLRLHDWSRVDMSECDLGGCDFTGARLTGCLFDRARIVGARFDRAEVDRAQLRRAADWPEHERRWRRASIPTRGDHLPDLAVFSDAPFAPELVVIPAGEFIMGSPEGYEDEQPPRKVMLGQRFAIGRYPVTLAEYDRFCQAKRRRKPDDQGWGRGRRPVINVSWWDARAYVTWLSHETGRAYRLPSEAEWEYACRAGTTSRCSFGDAITPDDANYADSGLGRTSEVGAYAANRWGLRDMHGNVWEWVEDDWHDNYLGAPADGSAWKDPGAAPNPRLCVLRGGSWDENSRVCRSACRDRYRTDIRNNDVGFRVARTLS